MRARILVIDDEALIRKSLQSVLVDHGFEVDLAGSRAEALEIVARRAPDLVVLDLRLPDADGLDLLQELRAEDPFLRVIMITAHGDVGKAVQAMKLGAADFLRKPYELEEILHVVRNAAQNLERDRKLDLYESASRKTFRPDDIVGSSETMRRLWDTVTKVAESDSTTVLIQGESGTGKELFARAVHHLSSRRDGPIVEINCSSFQEALLENELFGHEKGAFTGATRLKRGLVELCNGGTLFLDEVGEMPLVTQAKLLRFIDDRAYRRVGGSSDIEVDLRIVTATNARLEELVADGRFRKDLYYRLKVVALTLPPLRERGNDIGELARHYLATFSARFKKRFTDISSEVDELFRRHRWSGNVRELKNLLERVVLLEDGDRLEIRHLPDELQSEFPELLRRAGGLPSPRSVTPEMSLREAADQHILRVLHACDGNRSQAARVLDVSRQHLITRLKTIDADVATEPATR